MNTSYFAKYKGDKGVCISLGVPKWFKGKLYKKLAPTYQILNQYKIDNDEIKYTEHYTKEILNKLNPKEVYDELGEDSVLLCYEKSNSFCHRHIVAEWLERELGIKITEL